MSSSPKKYRNAHTIDQGLPLLAALGQPAVWEQACLGQDCQSAGGQGVRLASDSSWKPRGPGSHRASLGYWFGWVPCALTSLPPSVPRAVYVILSAWLEKYPGDFVQPPESPSLHALLAYLQVNVPGSDLERRARLLLSEGQHVEATEAEAGGEEDWG